MYEKLREEFMKKGCRNPKDIAIAIQVYLELTEVKKYWDVEYDYNLKLERLYFTAKKKKNEDHSVFIPVAVPEGLSFNNFQEFFQSLCANSKCQTIYLVIVSSDSTCVFYQMSNGLVEPSENVQKATKDPTQKLDKDLKKHRELLKEAALYGISISLPKSSTVSDERKPGTSKEK